MSRGFKCRFCAAPVTEIFADLGVSPLSNAFIKPECAFQPEAKFPLRAFVCTTCWLVQLEQFQKPDAIFNDYIYFSGYSDSWLRHCEAYADKMIAERKLDRSSLVIELASNDGSLLKFFVKRGIPALGIEPASNVAKVAIERGVPTESFFFGVATAKGLAARGLCADLIAANNVLAHVPDINDFVGGARIALKPDGVITYEYPSLERLIAESQFDTIYHEHFSYLSLMTVQQVLAKHGLRVFDVEALPTHGGSLRVYGCHDGARHRGTSRVAIQLKLERAAGLTEITTYRDFGRAIVDTKDALLKFLHEARATGKCVVGYGAPAKANTLLNYCGIGTDLITFTVDRSPYKQGLLMPGSHIPVRAPEAIFEAKPDYVIILPWNLQDEVVRSMARIRDWGGRFVVPIPKARVLS